MKVKIVKGKGWLKITDMQQAKKLVCSCGGRIDKGWLYLIPSYLYTTESQWLEFYTRMLNK